MKITPDEFLRVSCESFVEREDKLAKAIYSCGVSDFIDRFYEITKADDFKESDQLQIDNSNDAENSISRLLFDNELKDICLVLHTQTYLHNALQPKDFNKLNHITIKHLPKYEYNELLKIMGYNFFVESFELALENNGILTKKYLYEHCPYSSLSHNELLIKAMKIIFEKQEQWNALCSCTDEMTISLPYYKYGKSIAEQLVRKYYKEIVSKTIENEYGTTLPRYSLHNVFGGQRKTGISTPKDIGIIFLFTGYQGKHLGYQDYFSDNYEHYYYTMEGINKRYENPLEHRGNKAIMRHRKNNKRIFLYEKIKVPYRYPIQNHCLIAELALSKDKYRQIEVPNHSSTNSNGSEMNNAGDQSVYQFKFDVIKKCDGLHLQSPHTRVDPYISIPVSI